MNKTPFPPFQKRLLPSKVGNGMDYGQTTRTGNTVWHTMVGSLNGTDAYFRMASVAASTNWGIGGSLDGNYDGVIYQWVEIGGMLIPWASGPWRAPGYGDGAEYVRHFDIYGINAKADSIEFSGQVDTPMTEKQWISGMWLTAAILHDGGRKSDTVDWWNMHHREFTQPAYKDCPFERIYLFTNEYQTGIRYIMQHYEGIRVPDYVKIDGKNIPLPLGEKPRDPVDTAPKFTSYATPRVAILNPYATGRQWASRTATILKTYRPGDKVTIVGYYLGEKIGGSERWYVEDSPQHLRIHESGIKAWA